MSASSSGREMTRDLASFHGPLSAFVKNSLRGTTRPLCKVKFIKASPTITSTPSVEISLINISDTMVTRVPDAGKG